MSVSFHDTNKHDVDNIRVIVTAMSMRSRRLVNYTSS